MYLTLKSRMSTPVDIVISSIKTAVRPCIKESIFFWTKRILEVIPRSKYNFQVTVRWNNRSFIPYDFLMSLFFLKVLFNHKCNVQLWLFYGISLNIASRYLMKPFRKFLTDLLANYAIKKKMFHGSNIEAHRKIKTKEF